MAMLRMSIPKTLLRKVPGPGMRPHTPIRGCAADRPLTQGAIVSRHGSAIPSFCALRAESQNPILSGRVDERGA